MDSEDMDVDDESNSIKRCRWQQPQSEHVRNIANWEFLPYQATVRVFSYLCDQDRVAMAQVCRAWNNCFKNPSLWRTRALTLEGHSVKTDVCFSSIFGNCLQNVDLQIWYGLQRNLENIAKSVEIVTGHLKNARLHHFKLFCMTFTRFERLPELLNTIYTCIIKMFQTQTVLKKVILASCRLSQSIGTELLNTLATSTGKELVYLDIINYIDTNLNTNDLATLRETLTNFSNLTNISINYSCISDEVLRHWAVSLRHKLETMRIYVLNKEPYNHIIQRETWRELSSSCPTLKVTIMINGLSKTNEIIPILQPSIPLTTFIMVSKFVKAEFSQLEATLKHLACRCHHRLEYLMIECEKIQGFVDEGLVDVLEQCRRLQTFRFTGYFGITVPNKISELLRDNQSVLCSCAVNCDHLYDIIPDPATVKKMKAIESILPLKDDTEDFWHEEVLDDWTLDLMK